MIRPRVRQRTDFTHVLAAVHVVNRLELVGETLRHALNTLATVAPEWRRTWLPAEWFDRYSRRFEECRLPAALAARTAPAEQVGTDGDQLLTRIFATPDLAWLLHIPAVKTLWRVWLQQFYAGDPIAWRKAEDLPPSAVVVSSPYDLDRPQGAAHGDLRRGHPHIVTDVATSATTVDRAVTTNVQQRLAACGLTPREHPVNTGYATADRLAPAGPRTNAPCSGRSTSITASKRGTPGIGAGRFVIDWEREQATCPQGKTGKIWKTAKDSGGHDTINSHFNCGYRRDYSTRPRCVSPLGSGRC